MGKNRVAPAHMAHICPVCGEGYTEGTPCDPAHPRARWLPFEEKLTSLHEVAKAAVLMVEALREIGDGRGLVASHGDALDAGLRALAAARACGAMP